MKLWGGRFEKDTNELTDEFNASIGVDCRLYRQDIEGSIAHVRMLGKCGIITEPEAELIVKGLEETLADALSGKLELSTESEDIHMCIEKHLIQKIGETGKKLHTARSRNDQVALDLRIYLKEEIQEVLKLLLQLEYALLEAAGKYAELMIPGYTHMQKAQPITLGHHFMAYSEMFKRDMERFLDCYKRVDVMPLGSCALAGTTYPIDRDMVKASLGFSGITQNSIDGVADRDFAIEFISCCSIAMTHFSRFCEELILWSTSEFGFIELDDAYSTGSSIMPQKKNPDIAELIRGKTGRVYGDLITLLTVMKGLPLAYNKDLQEDKEAVFDAGDTLKQCITIFIPMFKTLKVDAHKIQSSMKSGFLNATDVADYLVLKGMTFRDAHETSGRLVLHCIESNKALEDLRLEEFKAFSQLFDVDVYRYIDLTCCVERRNIPGGPAPSQVKAAINSSMQYVNGLENCICKLKEES